MTHRNMRSIDETMFYFILLIQKSCLSSDLWRAESKAFKKRISLSRIVVMLKTSLLDLNSSQVRRMWQEIDSDGSGEVDFAEFTAWYVPSAKLFFGQYLRSAFFPRPSGRAGSSYGHQNLSASQGREAGNFPGICTRFLQHPPKFMDTCKFNGFP